MNSSHVAVSGVLRVGGWTLETFCEQRLDRDAPAEDVFVGLVHGRLRVAVVDPALNDLLPGRPVVAAHAWGRTVGFLRSTVDPFDALAAANDAVFDAAAGWLGGAMLCVAVIDLHPREPLLLRAVRAGDAEVWGDGPLLSGSCFTADAANRLAAARAAAGTTGADPRRWQLQRDLLRVDDYVCTPLGVAAVPVLQSWGPTRTSAAAVATDGAVSGGRVLPVGDLVRVCDREPAAGLVSAHGDRAVVSATFTG